MRLSISTLTHDAPYRLEMLATTVETFVKHTQLPAAVTWFVYANGALAEFRKTMRDLAERFQTVNFVTLGSNRNQGVGHGINQLNALTAGEEYTLFIEGDWICLHPDDHGQGRSWLIDALEVLDRDKTIDAFYLRRFVSPIDSRQTGLQHCYRAGTAPVEDFQGVRYFRARFNRYTNNPLLRRNSAFYRKGVFPLEEFFSPSGEPLELKGRASWGQAELHADDHLRRTGQFLDLAVLNWGVFVHNENTEGSFDLKTGRITPDPALCGPVCKWGYFRRQSHFCGLCRRSHGPRQLAEIFDAEMPVLRRLESIRSGGGTRQEILDVLRRENPDPQHNLEAVADWMSPPSIVTNHETAKG